MTAVEDAPVLKPPDAGGVVAESSRARRHCVLVLTYAPAHERLGSKWEIHAPHFTIGTSRDDLSVDGATQSGTRAELVWDGCAEWRVRGAGRLTLNGEAVVDCALRSGDELRLVDTFFRFISEEDIEHRYYETIYELTIMDFASGAHNQRFLTEMLDRRATRAARFAERFSVAVVAVERHDGNQTSDHDLLRPVADQLKAFRSRGWLAARTSNLELAIVAPETLAAFEMDLLALIRSCTSAGVQLLVGSAEYESEMLPEQILQTARARMCPICSQVQR